MSDETAAIPDELWGLRWKGKESQWLSEGDWDIAACVSREATQSDAFWSKPQHRDLWEPVLIGVSPATRDERDALRAEVERLKAELELRKHDADECCKAEKSVRKMLAAAMAELATLRGEGPIRVGDVVLVTDKEYGIQTLIVVHLTHDDQFGVWGHNGTDQLVWKPNRVLSRIGRAVRMPDGTPVDQ